MQFYNVADKTFEADFSLVVIILILGPDSKIMGFIYIQ